MSTSDCEGSSSKYRIEAYSYQYSVITNTSPSCGILMTQQKYIGNDSFRRRLVITTFVLLLPEEIF